MNRQTTLILSIASVLVYWGFLNLIAYFLKDAGGLVLRLIELLGGNTMGIIQSLCFGISLYCFLELRHYRKNIHKQFEGFKLQVLPSEDSQVITPQQVNKIKLDILYLERNGVHNEINEFVKKACTQYHNENSVSETLHVLESHINNKKEIRESGLENIKYGISANMSLGFIGTLIGLSSAIGNAALAKTEEGLETLTGYLYTAFDTTLISLLLAITVNFVFHQYIREIDTFYAQAKTYILDNLVSKIYSK